MPAFRKTPLNLALGVALGSLVMVPSLSSAYSVDMDDRELRTDDGGDTLLGPIYTTVYAPGGGGPIFDGSGAITGYADLKATTSFSITNTSPTMAVVAKVRFREQKRSMEAMDFLVVLSPNDQFSWWMGQDGARGSGATPYDATPPGELPYVQYQDGSCVIAQGIKTITPAVGGLPPVRRMSFPAPSQFVDNAEDLSLGHVEVIGMAGFGSNTPIYGHSTAHTDSACVALRNMFATRTAVEEIVGASDAPDVLTGRFVITANGQGIEYGDNMQAVKDTFNVPYLTAQNNNACVVDSFVGVTNPSLVPNPANALSHPCHSLYAWDNAESAHPHLGDANIPAWSASAPQIPNLDSEMQAHALSGDWSNNGANNVSTDWFINFADKYVYTDYVNCVLQAPKDTTREWCLVNYEAESQGANGPTGNVNRRDLFPTARAPAGTNEGTPWGEETVYLTQSEDPYNAATSLCLNGNYATMWDIDERAVTPRSPDGDPNFPICNETTVLTMLEEATWSGIEAFPSLVQYQDKRLVLIYPAFQVDNATNRGVARIDLAWTPVGGVRAGQYYDLGAATQGLQAVQRRTEGPEINNGTLVDLDRILEPPYKSY